MEAQARDHHAVKGGVGLPIATPVQPVAVGLAELTVVGDVLSYDPYGIMYRKDDPGMAQVVERVFIRLAETGAIVRLYNKWLLEPLPGRERLDRPMTPQLEEAFHSLGWPE
jgi:hypothetical protein